MEAALKHEKLISFRSSRVTTDIATAIQKLEVTAVERGDVKVHFKGIAAGQTWDRVQARPGPLKLPAHLSMQPAGREVYLKVSFTEEGEDTFQRREAELAVLWGLAIPLGFTPWQRFPVPGKLAEVFHFLGPWDHIVDSMHGEGRGEWAWPSVCAAAQCAVGKWEGDQPLERYVQAQLHRMGINCGPVDGAIGDRTLGALRALGLVGVPVAKIAEALGQMKAPKPTKIERQVGHVILPGGHRAFTSGQVQSMRTKTGYTLSYDGPGKVILMIEG